jgi:predicted Zn-dependent protease
VFRFTLWFALALAGCAAQRTNAIVPNPNASPLEKKLGDNPNDAKVNFALGQEAEAGGELLRAEQYYLRAEALGTSPDEVVPHIIKVLVKAHRYEEALGRCQRRLNKKPEDRATRYVAAAILAGLERSRDAERELTTLVRDKPDDPDAYLQLGRLYRDAFGDAAKSREMLKKYLELAPDGSEAARVRFELATGPTEDRP